MTARMAPLTDKSGGCRAGSEPTERVIPSTYPGDVFALVSLPKVVKGARPPAPELVEEEPQHESGRPARLVRPGESAAVRGLPRGPAGARLRGEGHGSESAISSSVMFAPPTGNATYCLPPTMYVIGAPPAFAGKGISARRRPLVF